MARRNRTRPSALGENSSPSFISVLRTLTLLLLLGRFSCTVVRLNLYIKGVIAIIKVLYR
jgi:hypothetical protein